MSLDELAKAIAHLPPELRDQTRQVWYEGTDEEFWTFFDWIRSLPDPPRATTVEDYIRSVDPTYWSDDELSEVH